MGDEGICRREGGGGMEIIGDGMGMGAPAKARQGAGSATPVAPAKPSAHYAGLCGCRHSKVKSYCSGYSLPRDRLSPCGLYHDASDEEAENECFDRLLAQ